MLDPGPDSLDPDPQHWKKGKKFYRRLSDFFVIL
jgi:hypothetical protein